MTTDQSMATRPLPTTSLRKTALIAGLLYLAHLCLDPDPRLVWIGARSELHHRSWLE
jgi:hypothetical protein